MSSMQSILKQVNEALSEPFDWGEVDKAMVELHARLTEPKWAIEDEALRDECEKPVVSWAAQRYLTDVTDLSSEHSASQRTSPKATPVNLNQESE